MDFPSYINSSHLDYIFFRFFSDKENYNIHPLQKKQQKNNPKKLDKEKKNEIK